MSAAKRWVTRIAVAAALVAGVVVVRVGGTGVPILSPGVPAPDFAARTLDTPPTVKTLADYRGEVVLLNLWATWCEPCKIEMPSIEALHRDYAGDGLKVLAIAVDDPGSEDLVRAFVARYGLTFEILSEGSGRIERDYQARGIPATYLIGRDGLLRKRVAGASDWSSAANRAVVGELLATPAPPPGAR